MELDKLNDLLTKQKAQLAQQLLLKENLEINLKNTLEGVDQLRGAIATLEYIIKESQPAPEDK